MLLVSPKQMTEIDKRAINDYLIPGIVLMENAAIKTIDVIKKEFGNVKGKNIIIAVGKGNNGGDGFAIARHLYNMGAKPKVFMSCDKDSIKGDARTNQNILYKIDKDIVLEYETNMDLFKIDIEKADLIIDALFGTGIKGNVRGVHAIIIDIVNNSGKKIISIDIPSGINGKTGEVLGFAVKANITVTFGHLKTGLVIYPGANFTGKIYVQDIGIPKKASQNKERKMYYVDNFMAKKIMPKRKTVSNKGDYGKILILTGSPGMTGSGCLSGKAALLTGAGLVYIGVPKSLLAIYDSMIPETVTIGFKENNEGVFSNKCIDELKDVIVGKTIIAAGPGMTMCEDVKDIIKWLITNTKVPLVLDADALNAISKEPSVLKEGEGKIIITPHPGEMARLINLSIKEVEEDRIKTAKSFADKYNVITILKGARTVTAVPNGNIYINSTGNAGMATAGSGDVLTGIIAGLLGQGIELEKAAALGVYLHGFAGDIATENIGMHSVLASDITDVLGKAIKEILLSNINLI